MTVCIKDDISPSRDQAAFLCYLAELFGDAETIMVEVTRLSNRLKRRSEKLWFVASLRPQTGSALDVFDQKTVMGTLGGRGGVSWSAVGYHLDEKSTDRDRLVVRLRMMREDAATYKRIASQKADEKVFT